MRFCLQEAVPDKVLVLDDVIISHPGQFKEKNGNLNGSLLEEAEAVQAMQLKSFQYAAVESHLLSFCDVFVVTDKSGFGRMAAFKSGRLDDIYVMPLNVQVKQENGCGYNGSYHVSLTDLDNQWSGF